MKIASMSQKRLKDNAKLIKVCFIDYLKIVSAKRMYSLLIMR